MYKVVNEVNQERRRFVGATAMVFAATQLGITGTGGRCRWLQIFFLDAVSPSISKKVAVINEWGRGAVFAPSRRRGNPTFSPLDRPNLALRLGLDPSLGGGGHMQVNYQQCWCFALSGAPHYDPERSTNAGLLGRTLRRVGGQMIVLAFVLLDIGFLAFAIVAPIWLAPWAAMNATVLVLGSLSWSEDRRIQRESATATQRQGIKVRAAEWRNLEELKRKVQSQLREDEQRQRREKEEREAQERLQAALRQAKEQLREAEQRQHQEERRRRQEREHAERLREAERQRRVAEQRRRQAEEEREAQRKQRREQKSAATQFQADWWIVLGVAPSASKDEIVRKYRHKMKQCHPDRVVRRAPQLLHVAEEQTKVLNGAYENALRARGNARPDAVAA